MIKIFILILFPLVVFIACNDKGAPYYVVDKIRTPAAQVYSQTTQTGQGCVAGSSLFGNTDTNIWCQQFPIRPAGTLNAAAATKVKLHFLALAPAGNPVTITLTHLKIFDLNLLNGSSGDGARGVNPSIPTTEIPLSDFGFNLNSSLSTAVQTTPMQIQTIVFDLEPPNLNALITYAQQINKFPGFVLYYNSSSPGQSYVDSGYLTFYLLPDQTDTSSWTTLNTSLSSFVTNAVLLQAQSLSSLNIPIQINSVSPSTNTAIVGNADNNISAQLTYNPSPLSFSPVQWYVSAGTMHNDRALSTSWNPQQNGNQTSVFVARDLLGGVDFKVNNYTAQ